MCVVFSHSEAGGHPTNEDAFEVRQHPCASEYRICVLADGQGGTTGGGEAARLASRTLSERIASRDPTAVLRTKTWLEAFRFADQAVLAEPRAGYTTLVGFALGGGMVVGASSGDSAAWLPDDAGSITDLTAAQLKNPPVGSGGARPTAFRAPLPARWLLLAMSDGVWKYAGRDRICDALRGYRGRELVEVLLAHARLPSGKLQDDFTAVVLQRR